MFSKEFFWNILTTKEYVMNLRNNEIVAVYVPAIAITQITARHMMGRVLVALAEKPEHICGVARRVGYTGKAGSDLAIYRLKVKLREQDNATMLSALFVVDDGLFVEYEAWNTKHSLEV